MSFTSRLVDLFLRLFVKPLLMFISIEPEILRKIRAFEYKHTKHSKNPQGSRIIDCELNAIPALIIQEDRDYQKEEGIILYFHGGAYCTASPWAYKRPLWQLTKSTNLPIVAIDYRQSPDYVFPAALDDSICAYQTLLDQGYAPETIFIMGDSAGGNLCLSTLLKIKQLQLPNPAAAVAMSPWADLSSSGDSVIDNARRDSYLPGFKQMDIAARLYAGDTPLDDPMLSPLFGDYSGLPPLKIIVGDIESLLDDARRVADKAIAAGVEVDYKAWRGQCHVFTLFPFLPEAKQAQREIRAFVDKYKPAAVQAAIIAAWATRYIEEAESIEQKPSAIAGGHVLIEEKNKQFTRTVITDSHVWLADEPTAVGGSNLGPDPYQHLLAALGSCTSMTIRMYANHKNIPLKDVSVTLSHNRQHASDCEAWESTPQKIEVINRKVRLVGDLTDEVRQRLLQIADRSPIYQTLHSDLKVVTVLA